jgi:UDP-galactopyranose mutase
VKYDAVIVGAGLFGATVARCLLDAGKRVLVLEKRPVIGGNCHDSLHDGVMVNWYGGHIFHTSNQGIWDFATRFAPFRQISHRVKAAANNTIYSFPINLMTLQQLWGVTTRAEAERLIEERRYKWMQPQGDIETYVLHHYGPEIYETFIYGYTIKQWDRDPMRLPASIIKRVPVRMNWDDRYFSDTWEGVPTHGYTDWITSMLGTADIRLNVDYLEDQEHYDSLGTVTIYSGPIDALFNYRYGKLEYRSLAFHYETGESLGCATLNQTKPSPTYTRQVDFAFLRHDPVPARSVVMTEYPTSVGDPMYPIRDEHNVAIYEMYRTRLRGVERRLVVGGRLGSYQYYNMDQVIGMGLKTGSEVLHGLG